MEKVDLVLVSAEGVVESGGIINKVSVSFLHHSVNSGLLKFGFFEAFQAFEKSLPFGCYPENVC